MGVLIYINISFLSTGDVTKKIILEGQLDQPKTDILIIAPWFKEFHTYNHALHPAEHEKLADILIQLIQDLRRINLNIE